MTPTLLDKREARIRRMFGEIAPWYDRLNHLLSLNIDKSWRRRTTQLVPPAGDDPILDLCTGTGDLALAYDRAAGGRVPIIAADFCHPMLVRATAKAAGRIRIVEADSQALPFPADTFQITCVAFGLRNVTDYRRGLAEMARVTRKSGQVAVLEFSKPRHPIFGRLYRSYFRHVLPRVGQFCSRSSDSAYSYLPASVMAFPDYDDLLQEMAVVGLTRLKYHPLTMGIATLYVGVKP